MERCIDIGAKINLRSSNGITVFTINDVLGVGGSCIAYDVSYIEDVDILHRGILKEFCPAFLEINVEFRRENNAIVVPREHTELFASELERFRETYKSINSYLSENLSASNYHTVQLGLYEGNNTLYTLTSKDYGKSYDKIKDDSLCSALKIALSVTKAVELYHNAGYVHLDIKPKNILVLDEVTDLVKLFDFDSLTSVSDLRSGRISVVPVPEDYYVPELVNGDIRNVGIQTDIFEIGAMLFSRLFGRAPVASDLSYDKQYSFDSVKLAAGISPQAKFELETLFKNTLQISRRRRYKSTEALKAQLEKAVAIIDSRTPYPLNLPKWQPSSLSVGREDEIKDIKTRLDNDGYVFIKAMGGMGKSELTKLFAQKYAEEYHTVQFCKYADSLKTLVASMPFEGLIDESYKKFDDLVKEKNKLLHMCDRRTLIVVDNFNVTYDDFLRDFLPSDNSGFKVIFTTRCSQAANYYEEKTYRLQHLPVDECKTLFSKYCPEIDIEEENEALEAILKAINYNTLTLILLASAIKKNGMDLLEISEIISNQELDRVETEVFHEYDFDSDEIEVYNRINSHLKTIFNLSSLSDIERETMKNMTLVAPDGIDIESFTEDCSIDEKVIDSLVDYGWIEANDGYIALHPIVSDLIANDKSIKKENSYYVLAELIEDYCNPDYESHIAVIMDRLAFAMQLERRYKDESAMKRAAIKAKLGRMYENIYCPNEARKYLKQALEIAQNEKVGYFTPYIYHFMGSVEKDFGTLTKAIEYYQLSVNTAKSIKIRYYNMALDSMLEIAKCYEENNNLTKAFKEYKTALTFAKTHFFRNYIYKITDSLSKIGKNLGWTDKVEKYEKIKQKHQKQNEAQNKIPEFEKVDELSASCNIAELSMKFERYLSRMREELGEDSPLYKDLSNHQWTYLIENGKKAEAMRSLSESMDFIESVFGRDSMEMARKLCSVADILPAFGDIDYSLQCALRAAEICKNNGEEHSYVFLEANLALVQCYFLLGKLSEAEKVIDCLNCSEFSGNEFLGDLISGVGIAMCELSKFNEAEALALRVLKQQENRIMPRLMSYTIFSIVNEHQGNLDEAEKYCKKAEILFNDIPDFYMKKFIGAQVYRTKARIYYRRLEPKKSIRELDTFISMFCEEELKNALFHVVFCERGLYYAETNDFESAKKDLNFSEKILINASMPKERYLQLYNNFAYLYMRTKNFEEAVRYLQKCAEINPEVRTPNTFPEAVICSSWGRVELEFKRNKEAQNLLHKAINCFTLIGSKKTNEFFMTSYNLAQAYINLEDWQSVIDTYNEIYFNIDYYIISRKDEYRKVVCLNYLYSLLSLERYEEAYKFAMNEAERFLGIYGLTSLIYIDTISKMGSYFKFFGFRDCFDFFDTARDAVEEGHHENTVVNAYLLDYIGVYYLDLTKEYGIAKLYFEESKGLFEKLNLTDDELYQVVLENIDMARDLIQKKLISNLAESMIDEES